MIRKQMGAAFAVLVFGLPALFAAEPVEVKPSSPSTPSFEPKYVDLAYGSDVRQVMDVWLVESAKPVPCVINIHGGGWLQGDKKTFYLNGNPADFLKEGIAVVSINYRYVQQTIIDSGSTRGNGAIQPRKSYVPDPPVSASLHDIARALQYVRSRSVEWNIDPKRIGVGGGSAGACSALWLAFHDDLADPNSADPVARQSTKPYCAAGIGPQTTLDPAQILEWTPNNTYGGHAFGYVWDKSDPTVEIRSFLADRESVKAWIAEYSPYALVSRDDPPVYMLYGDIPEKGKEQKDPVHSANYGLLLEEKLKEMGVDYEFVHKGVENPKHKNCREFFIDRLKH